MKNDLIIEAEKGEERKVMGSFIPETRKEKVTTMERLTECEELVMKIVWDAGEELSLMEIMQRVNDKFRKDWKPQTVSTFLARLVRKGYLKHYRQGRVFFYQILVPLEDYKSRMTQEFINFWHRGCADNMLMSLLMTRSLKQGEIEQIKVLLLMNGSGEICTRGKI